MCSSLRRVIGGLGTTLLAACSVAVEGFVGDHNSLTLFGARGLLPQLGSE